MKPTSTQIIEKALKNPDRLGRAIIEANNLRRELRRHLRELRKAKK